MSDDWTTPINLFKWLDLRFNFTLDAAASDANRLCDNYYTKEDNALTKKWEGSVFCNPPYSLDKEFVEYAKKQRILADKVCLVLPVRSDRVWFQKLLHFSAAQACWITGRLHFGNSGKGANMYSVIFYWAPDIVLPKYVQASEFNDNGKGGATT